jgi:hypothetical protein
MDRLRIRSPSMGPGLRRGDVPMQAVHFTRCANIVRNLATFGATTNAQ